MFRILSTNFHKELCIVCWLTLLNSNFLIGKTNDIVVVVVVVVVVDILDIVDKT